MTLTSPLPGGVSVDLHPGVALEVNDEKLKGAEFLDDGSERTVYSEALVGWVARHIKETDLVWLD